MGQLRQVMGQPAQPKQLQSFDWNFQGSPLQANLFTVKLMSQIAESRASNPAVRTQAVNILNSAGVQSHDYVSEAVAIGTWVQRNVAYARDSSVAEQLFDPLTLIEQASRGAARGDCDDMALLTASLLLAIGHTPFFRCVRYDATTGPYQHIYVVDYERGPTGATQRIPIDCIVKNHAIGYEVAQINGDEFPVLPD